MKISLFVLICIFLACNIYAQDERYFRQIFSGELKRLENKKSDEHLYSYELETPYYSLDLNEDGFPEKLVVVKRDSEDYLEIYNREEDKIYSLKFEPKGPFSTVYKVQLKKLSSSYKVLLVYYFEGKTNYINLQGTARVYAISIDDNKLNSMKTLKGPSIFEEYKSFKKNYHLRNYQVYLEDLDNNGIKDLVVKHNVTSEVFMYLGNGQWKTFSN